MGLITKSVKISPRGRGIKYYKNKGYNFTYGEEIIVDINDLCLTSEASIECICDYCGNIINMSYSNYNLIMQKPIKKIACLNCTSIKRKESNLLVYGVESTSKLNEVKEKTKNTFLEKYGAISPSLNSDIKEKIKQTNISKYGTENVFSSPEIKDKIMETNMQKYGVPNACQSKEVIAKMKNTMIKRYGVSNPVKSKVILDKIKKTNLKKYGFEVASKSPKVRSKVAQSLYINGTTPCSKQQKYLHQLFGGEINYPIHNYNTDICFPNEKLIIEYDGGGHQLSVKRGSITESEFNQKELIRDKQIKSEGYRIIRIISRKDYLPSDATLLSMLEYAKDFFNNNPKRTWINFDIDNNCIFNAYHKETEGGLLYDYGKLRRIK